MTDESAPVPVPPPQKRSKRVYAYWGVALALAIMGLYFALAPESAKPSRGFDGNSFFVVIEQDIGNIDISDEKAVLQRVSEIIDEETLEFWQKYRDEKGQPVALIVRLSGSTPSRPAPIAYGVTVRVHDKIRAALAGTSASRRFQVLKKPGAVDIEERPGRF